MDSDTFLVIGLIVGVLSIPAILAAYSESRAPRSAAILLMVASGLVALAVLTKPSGYSLAELPDVFTRVFAKLRY